MDNCVFCENGRRFKAGDPVYERHETLNTINFLYVSMLFCPRCGRRLRADAEKTSGLMKGEDDDGNDFRIYGPTSSDHRDR